MTTSTGTATAGRFQHSFNLKDILNAQAYVMRDRVHRPDPPDVFVSRRTRRKTRKLTGIWK